MIRFHLDEHVDHAVAHGLRLRGIDVTTTSDAGLIGASDVDHINYANTTDRVILTHDDDFLRHHQSGTEHSGIVYARQGSQSIGEIVRFLMLIHDCFDPEDIRGQVEFL